MIGGREREQHRHPERRKGVRDCGEKRDKRRVRDQELPLQRKGRQREMWSLQSNRVLTGQATNHNRIYYSNCPLFLYS